MWRVTLAGQLNTEVQKFELRETRTYSNIYTHLYQIPFQSKTATVSIRVKVVERIIGDWVVKESSTMYIKDDASTIYFPLEVEPGSSQLITYTYKKEWK